MRSRMTALGAVSRLGRCANRLPTSAVAAWSLAAVLAVCVAAPAPGATPVEASAPLDRLACVAAPGPVLAPPARVAHTTAGAARTRLSDVFGAAFVENRGQVAGSVAFYLPVGRDRVWVTPRELVFDQSRRRQRGRAQRLRFTQRLVGARTARVEGRRRLAGHANFLRSGAAGSAAGVGRFAEVVQRDAWRGIDVRLRARDRTLEQDFVIRPGGDVRDVRIAYRGIRRAACGPRRVATDQDGVRRAA